MLGGVGQKAWQYGRNAALGAAEYMTPVLTESQFTEKGVLTPEEFVKAGDMLVLRCPTWQWQAGDPANARPFLPPDKQFLFTRNVPCQRRAASLMSGAEDEQLVDGGADEEGWLSAHASHVVSAAHDEEVPDMVDATSAMGGLGLGLGAASSSAAAAVEDGLEDLGAEPDDPSALPCSRMRKIGDVLARGRPHGHPPPTPEAHLPARGCSVGPRGPRGAPSPPGPRSNRGRSGAPVPAQRRRPPRPPTLQPPTPQPLTLRLEPAP